MRPAWSVILFTTLAGAGQGLFLALVAADFAAALGLLPAPAPGFFVSGAVLSAALLASGLAASFFHLGRPGRAWRGAAQWRTSWLAREAIALPAFAGTVFAYGTAHLFWPQERALALGIGAAGTALCLALFLCTGMIYACLKFLQEWHTALTPLNYFLLGTASGCTLAALLGALAAPRHLDQLVAAALALGALAYASRLVALARNARLRPRSTLASAIGIKHPRIAQTAQGFMGGSFNTREFFHGRSPRAARAVRHAFLALVFPAPALLLVWGGDSVVALGAAFALQCAGLLAERWVFFAEARHPQNLYYQAMS